MAVQVNGVYTTNNICCNYNAGHISISQLEEVVVCMQIFLAAVDIDLKAPHLLPSHNELIKKPVLFQAVTRF